MKSHSNQTRHKIKQEHLVEQMELPKDIFLGMPLLSMEGNRTLCIVNHRHQLWILVLSVVVFVFVFIQQLLRSLIQQCVKLHVYV